MLNHHHNTLIDLMGGTVLVAKAFHVSSQAVSKWRRTGIPKDKVMILSMIRENIISNQGGNLIFPHSDLVQIVQKIPLNVSITSEGESSHG